MVASPLKEEIKGTREVPPKHTFQIKVFGPEVFSAVNLLYAWHLGSYSLLSEAKASAGLGLTKRMFFFLPCFCQSLPSPYKKSHDGISHNSPLSSEGAELILSSVFWPQCAGRRILVSWAPCLPGEARFRPRGGPKWSQMRGE